MNSFSRFIRVLIFAWMAFLSEAISAENWFESETRTCDFNSPVSFSQPFPRKNKSAGGQVFSVPKGNLNKILAVPNGAIKTSANLSVSDIAHFKVSVEALRAAPQFASVALSITGEIKDFSGVFDLASKGLKA